MNSDAEDECCDTPQCTSCEHHSRRGSARRWLSAAIALRAAVFALSALGVVVGFALWAVGLGSWAMRLVAGDVLLLLVLLLIASRGA